MTVDAAGRDDPITDLQRRLELLHLLLAALHRHQDEEIEDAQDDRKRRELQQQSVSAGTTTQLASTGGNAMSDEAFLARVHELIAASESRQSREMALRMAQVVRDVDTQRRTDMVRLADGMGVIEGRAVSAVAQQRQMIDYLMRVSSQRDPRQ